jgi:hypothetical protein
MARLVGDEQALKTADSMKKVYTGHYQELKSTGLK